MRKIRDSETVARIDDYIAENYPKDGPDKVADALNEPRTYIQERAWKNHIKLIKRPGRKKLNVEIVVTDPIGDWVQGY